MIANKPSLRAQALAVERAAANQRGHVNNLRDLLDKGKRSQLEFDQQVAWTPDLEAAAVTMRELAEKSP